MPAANEQQAALTIAWPNLNEFIHPVSSQYLSRQHRVS
jgi:hypothetical protein